MNDDASQRPDGDRRAADRVAVYEGLGAEFARVMEAFDDLGTHCPPATWARAEGKLAAFCTQHRAQIAAALSAVVPEARATEASPDLRALARKWREASMGDFDESDYTVTLQQCADELERALVRPQGDNDCAEAKGDATEVCEHTRDCTICGARIAPAFGVCFACHTGRPQGVGARTFSEDDVERAAVGMSRAEAYTNCVCESPPAAPCSYHEARARAALAAVGTVPEVGPASHNTDNTEEQQP